MSQQHLVPFATSAVFCASCGMLLPLTSHQTHAECRFCKQLTSIADLVGNEVVNRKELNQRKEWMETAEQRNKFAKGPEKVIVHEDCPICPSKKLYYMTRQMRSADEGQTVFYECIECGHKWTVNT